VFNFYQIQQRKGQKWTWTLVATLVDWLEIRMMSTVAIKYFYQKAQKKI